MRPEFRSASRSELFERLCSGDQRAGELLYLQYYPHLMRFAFRYVLSRETADEVVQDVFVTLWERRATLGAGTDVNTYLYTAVCQSAFRVAPPSKMVGRARDRVARLGASPVDWNLVDQYYADELDEVRTVIVQRQLAMLLGEPRLLDDTCVVFSQDTDEHRILGPATDAWRSWIRVAAAIRWGRPTPRTGIVREDGRIAHSNNAPTDNWITASMIAASRWMQRAFPPNNHKRPAK